jgi:hypothetical protein
MSVALVKHFPNATDGGISVSLGRLRAAVGGPHRAAWRSPYNAETKMALLIDANEELARQVLAAMIEHGLPVLDRPPTD